MRCFGSLSVHHSKVPAVKPAYWLAKLSASSVGDALSAFLTVDCDFGVPTTLGALAFFAGSVLISQLSFRQYVPGAYWLTYLILSATATSVAGALASFPAAKVLPAGSFLVVFVLGLWYKVEGTLNITTITTLRRESLYWLTILVILALGKAIFSASTATLDSVEGTVLFASLSFVVPGLIWKGFNADVGRDGAFWVATLLTRPFGQFAHVMLTAAASAGDDNDSNLWNGSADADETILSEAAGLDLIPSWIVTYANTVVVVVYVVYFTLTRADVVENGPHRRESTVAIFEQELQIPTPECDGSAPNTDEPLSHV